AEGERLPACLWRAGGGGERQNRAAVWRQRGPTHEVYLPTDAAVLNRADRLGADLPCQIHLQSAVDRHKMVEPADDLGVVGVGNRVQLDRRIVIDEVHQALGTHDKTADHLAAIDGLAGAGDHPSLDEVDNPIREHFGVNAQITTVGQYLQDGIGNGADA